MLLFVYSWKCFSLPTKPAKWPHQDHPIFNLGQEMLLVGWCLMAYQPLWLFFLKENLLFILCSIVQKFSVALSGCFALRFLQMKHWPCLSHFYTWWLHFVEGHLDERVRCETTIKNGLAKLFGHLTLTNQDEVFENRKLFHR